MSWRDLATATGRDRQWVKNWFHSLHNIGWATVTALPGSVNMIKLHTDRDAHVEYRDLVGGETAFRTWSTPRTAP
ncbi:hypothetical protein ACFWB2_32065 [Streptomyces virginiae]|uniref:hypothetical protein n=1 Tax=Streptomyces virginiae TaxID=1961 RepID=UPI0036917530